MNKLLLSVFMAGLSFMALPHTENEKLEVGRYMARFVKASILWHQHRWMDC